MFSLDIIISILSLFTGVLFTQRLHEAQDKLLSAMEERAEYGPDVPLAKRLAPSSEGSVTGPYPNTLLQYEDSDVDHFLKVSVTHLVLLFSARGSLLVFISCGK